MAVVVTGLGFGLGVLIGLPRLVTVGFDVMVILRASSLRENLPIEALRFFGDGLLGRSSSNTAWTFAAR